MNPYIPKHLRERQRPIDNQVAKLELECRKQLVEGLFLFFKQVGGSQKNGTSHKNENGKDSKDGKNGTNKYSLSESSVVLRHSRTIVVFSSRSFAHRQ